MYRKYFKRLIDILLSLMLIPFIFPIIMVCALFIMFKDGRPVFYCGERVGRYGHLFIMYKLRTMKVNSPDIRNADGSTYNSEDDERLTKTGKILRKVSLDELPQLFNVIKGDMSFIGPRPDLKDQLEKYTMRQRIKLSVLPGITGYNQAFFRNSIPLSERLKKDVHYVENLTFFFDVKILFATILTVIKRKNIYISKINIILDCKDESNSKHDVRVK